MVERAGTRKHADLIYDIGMHRGEDTEFYLRKGFRVVAIEADPDLASACRERFREFIERGQLSIVQGAIVEEAAAEGGPAKIPFFKNDEHSVWGTVHAEWAERNRKLGTSSVRIEVAAISLTSVLREHGIPRFMKIDIEGCDMVCIEALKSFRERPDYVSLESDKTGFERVAREIDALTELGYDAFQAVEQSGLHLAQAPPLPAREGQYVAHRFELGSSGLFGNELGGAWRSSHAILRQYRVICLGYALLGDDGVLSGWSFPGAQLLRAGLRRVLGLLTRAAVPGWYDTHARHSTAI